MTTYATVVIAALWSVTFGYEPSPDAQVGYDYIVQVEPEMFEALEQGEVPSIEANLPPEVTPVRRVRIVVGQAELPRKLRPPVPREARRPEVDAGISSTLLAQTGPAGGFGRSATGFQNGPAASPSGAATVATPSPPTGTVPPPETRYQAFQYANPAGGANSAAGNPSVPAVGSTQSGAGTPLEQVRDDLRGATNSLGQAGQQVLDTTREVIGGIITPPANTGFDAQGRPLANIAERLQSEVRNTAEALREPWQGTATTPTSNHVPNTSASSGQRQFDNWNPATGAASTSPPAVTSQPSYPPANYPNDRYAQEHSVLNQGQGQGQATSAPGGVQPPLLEAPEGGNPAGNYAPTQNRNPVDLGNWADNRGTTTAPVGNTGTNYDPNQGFATGTAPSNAGQQPGVTIPRGSDWQGQGNSGGTPVNSHTIPQVGGTTVSPAPVSVTPQNPPQTGDNSYPPPLSIGNASNDMPPFGVGGNSGGNTSFNQSYGEPDLGGSGRTVLNFMAWIVAAGAVAGNLFQWGSIVALRNKYRVALRRNSPGFGRSMAA